MTYGTLDEVLDWVNEVRVTRGLDPLAALPPGVPCDPSACPVSRALDADIRFDGRAVARGGAWPTLRLPLAARRFTSEFDVGLYPALEEREHARALVLG